MKILSILGSPRKDGNTARVLGWAEDELREAGHGVERIDYYDLTVCGCTECKTCASKPDEPGCAQDDDANGLFGKMIDADAVIFSSPLFCWGFPGSLKNLFDRMHCLITGYMSNDHRSLIGATRSALLVTCSGPVDGNADLVRTMFDRIANFAKLKVTGKTIVPFCTKPDAMGDEQKKLASELVENLVG